MKHIFVINPKAGKSDRELQIRDYLSSYPEKLDIEIYVTKSKGDGREFTRQYLKTHPTNCMYRFYACGGDGTLHDVVNGAVGYENAEVACLAFGSGNDFIKNFENTERFKDIGKVIRGKAKKIDILKVDDKYSINIFNYGFDGEATFAMLRFKRWPGISGPLAYKLGALNCLLFKMNQYLKITVDSKVAFDGKGLLIAVANGLCYGGGYYCAPEAKIDDGLIDVCLVKKISRFKAASLMKVYKKGEHLKDPSLKDLIYYTKCKSVIVESNKPVAYAIDGEVFRKQKVVIDMAPSILNFVIPEE